MAQVLPLPYRIAQDCSVTWTATQEKAISKEYPLQPLTSEATAQEFVTGTYLKCLWLPESIMPLRCVVQSMLRVDGMTAAISSTFEHPLRQCLVHILLTPRASSSKYHTTVPALIEDETSTDPEANLLWYAFRHERMDVDENASEQEQEAAEERWKTTWLERMERREVMIQILLHLLLLSVTPPDSMEEEEVPIPTHLLPPYSPKKRQRQIPDVACSTFSFTKVEERLESFMDKLSMWQLASTLDNTLGGSRTGFTQALVMTSSYSKQRVVDERDWMQIYCEDVVEPLFRSKLPSQCALLRSKVFPSSPFSEDAESNDSLSPPLSPKPHISLGKRHKTSGAASSRRPPSPKLNDQPKDKRKESHSHDRQLACSRSLSVTLEEERERSRSLSIGPAKRTLVREVSMSTVFKGTSKTRGAQAKSKVTRTLSSATSMASQKKPAAKRDSGKGKTLVAATPDKSKSRVASSSLGTTLPKLPTLLSHSSLTESGLTSGPVEGDDDDDEWRLTSSPDILLLGTNGWDVDPEGNSQHDSEPRVLIDGTPTKKARR